MLFRGLGPLFGAVAAAVAAIVAPAGATTDDTLEALTEAPHRAPENVARNPYRNPVETLRFFGIEPDMTVVEIWPGSAGWYTEILAPYLHDEGTYYAAGFDRDVDSEFLRNAARKFAAKLAAHPEIYDKVRVTEFSAAKTAIAPPGSADLVLTFRNVHNWMRRGDAAILFDAMYRALNPGGILGLVQHRGDPETPQDPAARSGYVHEAHVVALAEKAGFELVARSEINANPKDTKDHPEGVWTLPPNLRLGDVDRDKYLAIGESDRMTLKFRKPE